VADLTRVTPDTFASEVLEVHVPVLVDFYADWCGPCRALEPALKDLAVEYDGEVRIVKVDVEAYPDIQEKYGVLGLPTMIIFKRGEIVDRLTGGAPRSKIAAAIEKVMGE
jgi:thioredoxin 1